MWEKYKDNKKITFMDRQGNIQVENFRCLGTLLTKDCNWSGNQKLNQEFLRLKKHLMRNE